jgi:hypothetical protein
MSEFAVEPIRHQLCELMAFFLKEVGGLQAAIPSDTEAIPASGLTLNAVAVQQQVVQLQQHFQQIVGLISEAGLDLACEQRLRPYQTEGHRLLRLMGVAALKLRATKQPETLAQQQQLIVDQLARLQLFAQAIADDVCNS